MKKLLVVIVVAVVGFALYQKRESARQQVVENPVYAEVRMTATFGSREIETAVFIRSANEADCEGRGTRSWVDVLEDCPTCKLEKAQCHQELPPRYARLFDDVPIPSAYLSATAGNASERDGRIVVYGLSNAEGKQVCEVLKKGIRQRYTGKLACIPPSGG